MVTYPPVGQVQWILAQSMSTTRTVCEYYAHEMSRLNVMAGEALSLQALCNHYLEEQPRNNTSLLPAEDLNRMKAFVKCYESHFKNAEYKEWKISATKKQREIIFNNTADYITEVKGGVEEISKCFQDAVTNCRIQVQQLFQQVAKDVQLITGMVAQLNGLTESIFLKI